MTEEKDRYIYHDDPPPITSKTGAGEYVYEGGLPDRIVKPPSAGWGEVAGETLKDAARSGVNSLWLGGGNRVGGAVNYLAGTSKASSLGGAIDEAVTEEEAGRARSPYGSAGGEVVGGIASGLALPVSRATTLPGKIWYGMKAGAGLGAAQGAGNTYTGNLVDYAFNAMSGGIYGGLLGIPATLAGSVAGGTRRVVDNIRRDIPRPLAEAAQADRGGLGRILAERNPNAMLVDTPSMMAQAQGVITSKGPGGVALHDTLTRRNDFSGPRVLEQTDQIYGRAVVPEHVERQIGERMAALSPEYERVLANSRPIDLRTAASWFDNEIPHRVGPARDALVAARRTLNAYGTEDLSESPRVLQEARETIRSQKQMAARAGDDKTAGVLGTAEDHLTRELQTKVPGIREIDHAYAELGAQQRAIRSDSPGAKIFESGRTNEIHPEVLRETLANAGQPKGVNVGPSAEAFRLQQASRAELDRRITNKPSVVTLNQVLGKDEADIANAKRLEIALGRPQKEQLDAVREAEALYKDRHGKIVEGSQTAHKTAAKEGQEASVLSPLPSATLYGRLEGGLIKLGNDLLEATNLSSRDRIAKLLSTHSQAELQTLIPKMLAELPTRESRAAVVETLMRNGVVGGSANVVGKRRNQPL